MADLKYSSDSEKEKIIYYEDYITAAFYDIYTAIVPAANIKVSGRKSTIENLNGKNLTNKKKVLIPEGTVLFMYHGSQIEKIYDVPGIYEFMAGRAKMNLGFATRLAPPSDPFSYINTAPMLNMPFETISPVVYEDHTYNMELEVDLSGAASFVITDYNKFLYFARSIGGEAALDRLTFDDPEAKASLLSGLLGGFGQALGEYSKNYNIPQMGSGSLGIANAVALSLREKNLSEKDFGIKILDLEFDDLKYTASSFKQIGSYMHNALPQ